MTSQCIIWKKILLIQSYISHKFNWWKQSTTINYLPWLHWRYHFGCSWGHEQPYIEQRRPVKLPVQYLWPQFLTHQPVQKSKNNTITPMNYSWAHLWFFMSTCMIIHQKQTKNKPSVASVITSSKGLGDEYSYEALRAAPRFLFEIRRENVIPAEVLKWIRFWVWPLHRTLLGSPVEQSLAQIHPRVTHRGPWIFQPQPSVPAG